MGPKTEMDNLIPALDEICEKVGRTEFPVTVRNIVLDEEQEKEFRELQAKVKKQIEEQKKQAEEQKK